MLHTIVRECYKYTTNCYIGIPIYPWDCMLWWVVYSLHTYLFYNLYYQVCIQRMHAWVYICNMCSMNACMLAYIHTSMYVYSMNTWMLVSKEYNMTPVESRLVPRPQFEESPTTCWAVQFWYRNRVQYYLLCVTKGVPRLDKQNRTRSRPINEWFGNMTTEEEIKLLSDKNADQKLKQHDVCTKFECVILHAVI